MERPSFASTLCLIGSVGLQGFARGFLGLAVLGPRVQGAVAIVYSCLGLRCGHGGGRGCLGYSRGGRSGGHGGHTGIAAPTGGKQAENQNQKQSEWESLFHFLLLHDKYFPLQKVEYTTIIKKSAGIFYRNLIRFFRFFTVRTERGRCDTRQDTPHCINSAGCLGVAVSDKLLALLIRAIVRNADGKPAISATAFQYIDRLPTRFICHNIFIIGYAYVFNF